MDGSLLDMQCMKRVFMPLDGNKDLGQPKHIYSLIRVFISSHTESMDTIEYIDVVGSDFTACMYRLILAFSECIWYNGQYTCT